MKLVLYVTFLTMFITVFITAIGSIYHRYPFDTIDASYTSKLFTVMITQIALIGLKLISDADFFGKRISRYSATVKYKRHSKEIISSLDEGQKAVWKRYVDDKIAQPSRQEQSLISEIKAAKSPSR